LISIEKLNVHEPPHNSIFEEAFSRIFVSIFTRPIDLVISKFVNKLLVPNGVALLNAGGGLDYIVMELLT
jgi:hypothetical protein